MFVGLLSLLPVAVECLRVADLLTDTDTAAVAANDGEKVEGKVTKCTVDDAIVFNQAADVSPFPARWEYLVDAGAGVDGWVIDVPEIVQIEVPPQLVADAKSGRWFKPDGYTAYNNDGIDQSGMAMQQILSGDRFLEKVRISWDSPSALTVFIQLRSTSDEETNVEIEFTRGPGRLNLRALEYYMPMQGSMISLTVDGKTVYDKASTTTTFPVVCTPAFFNVGKVARGLDVNVAELTWFWVRMSEMQKNGHFAPNSHGYPKDHSEGTAQLMEGLKKWGHATKNGVDVSAELTIRNDASTVEISGNGTSLVFAKENVVGNVIKCTVANKIVYDQVASSTFPASWEFMVDENAGVNGWVINIPSIVQFKIDSLSLMESNTTNLENKFAVSEYIVYPDDTENMDELTSVRAGMSGENIVETVSIKWDSHQTIKLVAHVRNGQNVEIEFTRGPSAANAEHYDKA